jgi:20S proteasome alpha/beta subunit
MTPWRRLHSPRCCLQRSLLFWLVFVHTTTTFSDAAHSRRRIVVRRGDGESRYDRTITEFSADGRLAQVEYAMEAALRGSTIAAINVPRAPGVCFVVDASGSSSKVHRIDHHVWLVTAGLSGDARVLAQSLRTSCQNHRLNYGDPPTTEQVARMAGQAQHELTRMAGARPLGCTALVVGIDSSNNNNKFAGTPHLFETDPGGIVEECQYAVAGKGRASLGRTVAPLVLQLVREEGNESPPSKWLEDAATGLAEVVLNQMSDSKRDSSSVDVWTLQPNPAQRGGMQATCYRNIEKGSLTRIKEQEEKL